MEKWLFLATIIASLMSSLAMAATRVTPPPQTIKYTCSGRQSEGQWVVNPVKCDSGAQYVLTLGYPKLGEALYFKQKPSGFDLTGYVYTLKKLRSSKNDWPYTIVNYKDGSAAIKPDPNNKNWIFSQGNAHCKSNCYFVTAK